MRNVASGAIVLIMTCGLLLCLTEPVAAQRSARRGRSMRAPVSSNANARPSASRPNASPRTGAAYDWYPRYTGAFHARYFDDLPSVYGDHPLRGPAW